MFESLSDRLAAIFTRLRSRGKLSEADVSEVLREVRIALLEADVNLALVKDFIARIRERAVGAEVLESMTPAQAVIAIVRDGLIELLGSQEAPVRFAPSGVSAVMLAGLQGSGKTTQAAKLAALWQGQGRRPLLVACDVHRPAAVEQLIALGAQIEVPVYSEPGNGDAPAIARRALEQARRTGNSVAIFDTAGRLQIDEPMMAELERVKTAVEPIETLLVVDAMTGQEAVKVATTFDQRIGVTGMILTKLDGDARGGAALSIRAVTGKPVKFIGVGEKIGALEPFYPDRLVSRVLGMGDVLTLIEKSQRVFDERQAKKLATKIRDARFTLSDFLEQMRQIKRMGSVQDLLKMIPGMGKLAERPEVDERELARVEAIILSMTPQERDDPRILNASRRRRIAAGSGRTVQDINRLVKQFEASQKMMRSLSKQRGAPRIPLH
ncbi:MAG: signal recognition particle protein [Candidatus Eremiobacteraeota bacterium]|nr:signal recognition particle protein [Candidatus Eremiobacteraeota bacterium]MBV8366631.1 signal recognition particle protein [Candidatus Eremiobacteraeota bacterium]